MSKTPVEGSRVRCMLFNKPEGVHYGDVFVGVVIDTYQKPIRKIAANVTETETMYTVRWRDDAYPGGQRTIDLHRNEIVEVLE